MAGYRGRARRNRRVGTKGKTLGNSERHSRIGNRLAGLRSYEDQISDRNNPTKRASAGGRFGRLGKFGKLGALKGAG